MIRKHFRLKRIALGLALAAVAAPSAQATVLLDGHPAPVSYTAVPHQPIASEISVQAPVVSQLQVEGLRWQAMANAYQAQSPVKSENSFGVPGPSLAGATGPQVVATSAGTTSNGFNWSDAGIGASVAFGAALMLLMAVILGRKFRSRPTGLAST
jgi:hypothetical protein